MATTIDSDPSVSDLTLVSGMRPASQARAWQSAPHPFLPLIATASSDKAVRIYSLSTFALVSTITGGHTRSVRAVAWKPSLWGEPGGSTLATGSFDASAGIWRGDPPKVLAACKNNSAGTASTGNETTDAVDEEDGQEQEDLNEDDNDDDDDIYHFAVLLDGHDSEIKSVAWSPGGSYLATCSRDKSVWIWEALDGGAGDDYETVAVLAEHEADVKCVAWHPVEEACLASASYDETVRVWREDPDGEWVCVARLEGHDGTVWCVAWEPVPRDGEAWAQDGRGLQAEPSHDADEQGNAVAGPRLITSSDDLSIRVWRRTPKAPPAPPAPVENGAPRIRSIIRSATDEEDWTEQAELPRRHTRAIYAVAWSSQSRRVVSCGGDGRIVVYEELSRVKDAAAKNGKGWVVVAEVEAAHGVHEVNHVCWARRADRGKKAGPDGDEEVVVSTGDDGEVKIWTVNGK